jgi:type VI secretion system protein ImpG
VLGIDRITGTQTSYEPLYSFSNIGNRKINTYATRFIINAEGKREMNIQLGGAQLDKKQINQETLVIDAWCTNGNIPRESIHEGEITNPGKGFSDFLKLTNLTRPTLPVAPPLDNELLWMFQTHLAATQAGLTTKGILKKFLQIYNWSGLEGNDRRIDSISDVKSEPVESVYKGSVIRGLLFTVTLEEIAFKDNGDLHLFGFVLLQFLSHYVQLNTFCELQFILKPTGKTMSWNYIEGKRCLI